MSLGEDIRTPAKFDGWERGVPVLRRKNMRSVMIALLVAVSACSTPVALGRQTLPGPSTPTISSGTTPTSPPATASSLPSSVGLSASASPVPGSAGTALSLTASGVPRSSVPWPRRANAYPPPDGAPLFATRSSGSRTQPRTRLAGDLAARRNTPSQPGGCGPCARGAGYRSEPHSASGSHRP